MLEKVLDFLSTMPNPLALVLPDGATMLIMLVFAAIGTWQVCSICQRDEWSTQLACFISFFVVMMYFENWIGDAHVIGGSAVMEATVVMAVVSGVLCLFLIWIIGVEAMIFKRRGRDKNRTRL